MAIGLLVIVTGLLGPHAPPATRLAPSWAPAVSTSAGLATKPAAAGPTRRLLVRGAAGAVAAIAGRAHAADKLLWISGKSDPIRPTSKDKVDGTKKDPKCGPGFFSSLYNHVHKSQADTHCSRAAGI